MEARSDRGEGQSSVLLESGIKELVSRDEGTHLGTVSPTRGTDVVDEEENPNHGNRELVLPHSHSSGPK